MQQQMALLCRPPFSEKGDTFFEVCSGNAEALGKFGWHAGGRETLNLNTPTRKTRGAIFLQKPYLGYSGYIIAVSHMLVVANLLLALPPLRHDLPALSFARPPNFSW